MDRSIHADPVTYLWLDICKEWLDSEGILYEWEEAFIDVNHFLPENIRDLVYGVGIHSRHYYINWSRVDRKWINFLTLYGEEIIDMYHQWLISQVYDLPETAQYLEEEEIDIWFTIYH